MAYLLVVDDDADFAAALRTVLQSHGHQVVLETDAEKTIARIQDAAPTP